MYSFPKVCEGKLIRENIAIARVRVIEAIGDPMFSTTKWVLVLLKGS